jgi:hypothetical protein
MNNVFTTAIIDQKGMSFEMPQFTVFDSAIAAEVPSSYHLVIFLRKAF